MNGVCTLYTKEYLDFHPQKKKIENTVTFICVCPLCQPPSRTKHFDFSKWFDTIRGSVAMVVDCPVHSNIPLFICARLLAVASTRHNCCVYLCIHGHCDCVSKDFICHHHHFYRFIWRIVVCDGIVCVWEATMAWRRWQKWHNRGTASSAI